LVYNKHLLFNKYVWI